MFSKFGMALIKSKYIFIHLFKTCKQNLLAINFNFFKQISYMKPLFTNHTPTLIDTMPKFCLPVAKLLTTNEQLGNVKKFNQIITLMQMNSFLFKFIRTR